MAFTSAREEKSLATSISLFSNAFTNSFKKKSKKYLFDEYVISDINLLQDCVDNNLKYSIINGNYPLPQVFLLSDSEGITIFPKDFSYLKQKCRKNQVIYHKDFITLNKAKDIRIYIQKQFEEQNK